MTDNIQKYTYSADRYPFRKLFSDLIQAWDLENLHHLGGFESVGDEPGKDNNSTWHALFYERMRKSPFMECYGQFIKTQIQSLFKEPIIFQRYPTLRIQPPGGKGVAAYHVDADYNHPVEETNIWLPLTHAIASRTIWIESAPGKGDYTPQACVYGQYLLFPGGKLAHGNEVNTTTDTRISIDMRVIPQSLFRPSDKKGLAYGKVRNTEGEDSYYQVQK